MRPGRCCAPLSSPAPGVLTLGHSRAPLSYRYACAHRVNLVAAWPAPPARDGLTTRTSCPLPDSSTRIAAQDSPVRCTTEAGRASVGGACVGSGLAGTAHAAHARPRPTLDGHEASPLRCYSQGNNIWRTISITRPRRSHNLDPAPRLLAPAANTTSETATIRKTHTQHIKPGECQKRSRRACVRLHSTQSTRARHGQDMAATHTTTPPATCLLATRPQA